jgi:hypothetical protein
MQGPNMTAVDLADSSTSVGGDFQVTGWGDTYDGSHRGSPSLLKVTLPYVSNAVCNQPTSYNGAITAGMMCAGYPGGGKGPCQGDSGGPVVIYGNGPRRANGSAPFAVQVGVISWSLGCAAANFYSVSTRVSQYREWIAQETKESADLVRQDFSDCKNDDVSGADRWHVVGQVNVLRLHNGKLLAQVGLLRGRPVTTYQFFLKCGYKLGVLRTNKQGAGGASFEFPSDAAGNVFAFDMYPVGAPLGNKFQSVQMTLH